MPEGRLRAILADDHIQMFGAVERILGQRFEIEHVADGAALVEALTKSTPDLLILDISMPRMSGLEALKVLKDRGSAIPPTVVCSMHRDSEVLRAAMAAGARGYVFKARMPFELADAVDAVLDEQQFVSRDVGAP